MRYDFARCDTESQFHIFSLLRHIQASKLVVEVKNGDIPLALGLPVVFYYRENII